MEQTGYTHLKTPGINRIADLGVTFTRSYTPYPVCVAARASFMTGMMASKSSRNLTSYPSIGKTMLDAGYQTAYFGKWHVASSKMKRVEEWHGFEQYEDLRHDTKTRELSVDFLKENHEKPFFLITSFLNPHDCCELARNIAGLNDEYRDGPVEENMDPEFCPPLPANFEIPPGETEGFYCRRLPDSTDKSSYGKHPVKYWGETEWRQYMYGYDRLVEKVDQHILQIMNTLKEEGLLENTVVIYTSDHGDGHGAHQWNQKMTFYEETINIPFIVAWKGKTIAGKIDKETLVSNGLDMYPTICKLAGVPWPEELPGADLSPLAMQESITQFSERNYIVSEINQNAKSKNGRVVLKGRMVVSKNYKYILFDQGENREMFFDMVKDPGELNPVTHNHQYSDQIEAHRQYLREWISATSDEFLAEKIPAN